MQTATVSRAPLTVLDLMQAVSAEARTESEVVATVVYMIKSGRVRFTRNPPLPRTPPRPRV